MLVAEADLMDPTVQWVARRPTVLLVLMADLTVQQDLHPQATDHLADQRGSRRVKKDCCLEPIARSLFRQPELLLHTAQLGLMAQLALTARSVHNVRPAHTDQQAATIQPAVMADQRALLHQRAHTVAREPFDLPCSVKLTELSVQARATVQRAAKGQPVARGQLDLMADTLLQHQSTVQMGAAMANTTAQRPLVHQQFKLLNDPLHRLETQPQLSSSPTLL